MMCRGGLVVGESAGAFRAPAEVCPHQLGIRSTSTPRVLIAIGVLALSIAWSVPANIPPLIESDYAYLLTAADRWYAGLGPTTTPPVAPHQPWEWHADWTFLTKWPVGYPAILVALRCLLGVSTVQACHIVAWIAAAAALVGWYLWLRGLAARSVSGPILAAVGAASALTTSFFVNPSTDLILIATLPYVLLLVGRNADGRTPEGRIAASLGFIALAGLISGGLFAVRYASLFVPAGIAAFLGVEWIRRRASLRSLSVYCIAASAPIVTVVLLNRRFAAVASLQSQLNLGDAARTNFSWNTLLTAWSTFTDFGYYAHRPMARWGPIALPLVTLAWVLARKLRAFGRTETDAADTGVKSRLASSVSAALAYRLSAFVLAAGLLMLIVGSTFFRSKFDFVTLERYYLPLRPLYFALFLAPLLWIDRAAIRGILSIALVLAGSWTLNQDWGRDLSRWSAADHPATASGARSHCFEPGATELFGWLKSQNDASLVVFSNFHEFIMREAGIPAVPIPPDPKTLDEWLGRIAQARFIADPRPIFVLNPTNGTRDYWIPDPGTIVQTFDLRPILAPAPLAPYLFVPQPPITSTLRDRRTSIPFG